MGWHTGCLLGLAAMLLAEPVRAEALDDLSQTLDRLSEAGRPAEAAEACRGAELRLIQAGPAAADVAARCGTIQQQAERLPDASVSLSIALEAFRSRGDRQQAVTVALTLSRVYEALGDAENAQAAQRSALALAAQLPDAGPLGQALLAQARSEMDRGRVDLALQTAGMAQQVYLEAKDPAGLAATFRTMGDALIRGQNVPLARTAYTQARRHFALAQDLPGEARMLQALAETYARDADGDGAKAAEVLLSEAATVVAAVSPQTPETWRQLGVIETRRAVLLEGLGNPGAALQAHKRAYDAAEALEDVAGQRAILDRMIALAQTVGADHLVASFTARRDRLTAAAGAVALPPGGSVPGGQGILRTDEP